MRKIKWWHQLLYQLGLLAIAVFAILPVWGMVRIALDGSIRGAPTDFRILPLEWSLDSFQHVWEKPSQSLTIPGLLKNSLLVAGGAALLSIILGASMAYAFARFRFPGRKVGLFGLLIGALLPAVALMTPLYILLSEVGIRTSLIGLVIVYTAFAMPFCIWNMRTSFQAIPLELEEAAYLDGATFFTTFLRITFRLALPSIVITAVIAFLVGYTEFAIGWLFVESSQNVTLAMAVSGMMRMAGTEWSSLAAISILMSLPVVLLFFLLSKYLLRGQLIGRIEE